MQMVSHNPPNANASDRGYVQAVTGVRIGGWTYPIVHEDWDMLLQRYLGGPPLVRSSVVTDIVCSIVESPARADLRYATSMWALLVTPAPGTPGPVDAVRVGTNECGDVVVEHMPLVGVADRVERPSVEAVPLFWRFMKEKYGIEGRPTT